MAAQPSPEDDHDAPPRYAGDTDNLLALVTATHKLFMLQNGDEIIAASERSTAIQVVGDQVERRAHALIEQVRTIRGVPEPARVVPVPAPPPPQAAPTRLTGAHVRQAMARMETFTMSELVSELGFSKPTIMKFVRPMLLAETLKEDGRVGRSMTYVYQRPDVPPDPTSHPHGPDPERLAGVGQDRRATGEPVRVAAMSKLTRRGRSTGGVRHQHMQRDKAYDRMQDAKSARAEEQRRKAHEQKGK
jgi:hypothetical protein